MTEDQYQVERRADGAIVVRVRSQCVANKPPLPDAVFCFHAGDPQYDFWSRKLAALLPVLSGAELNRGSQ